MSRGGAHGIAVNVTPHSMATAVIDLPAGVTGETSPYLNRPEEGEGTAGHVHTSAPVHKVWHLGWGTWESRCRVRLGAFRRSEVRESPQNGRLNSAAQRHDESQ